MTNYSWIKYSVKDLPRCPKDKDIIIQFWKDFYASIKDKTDLGNQQGSSKSVMYKGEVFNILDQAKKHKLSSYKLSNLCLPITQDASASAYQIMSYFLMDETLAERTNLIPSPENKIQDVYEFMLKELKEFINVELDDNIKYIVSGLFTRKLVKSIFMPMIYGKTLMSTVSDLKAQLSHYLTHKDCINVASVCFKFWSKRYKNMDCLIRLIRNIGWIVSSRDRPVFYRVPFFTTVQDYMKMEPLNIWVYDRIHKKRHQVTLRVSSDKRDRRKTEISTFVNFIHQRDAHIAMKVVERMLKKGYPIYTVHDNFISTAQYCEYIPFIYSDVIRNMGPPLSIINDFIFMNIYKPYVDMDPVDATEGYFSQEVIPIDELQKALRKNLPENISKKMKATWDKRISVILNSYEDYTRIVCGDFQIPQDGWFQHKLKWVRFSSRILYSGEEGIRNYCVHY